jgi:hypothetical protein
MNKFNVRVSGKLGIHPQQSAMGIDYFSLALLSDSETIAASPDYSYGNHQEDTLTPSLIFACHGKRCS